jgi:hypothetical protein
MTLQYEWLPPEVELMTDVSPGDWVATRLEPWATNGARIASYMPDVFEAYARIFHPAGDRGRPEFGMRWSYLARRNGITFHSDIAFLEAAALTSAEDRALDEIGPMDGSLPLSTLESLVDILASHGDRNETAWFCMWEGNGTWWSGSHSVLTTGSTEEVASAWAIDEERDRVLRGTPTVPGPSRAYFLMRGSLGSVVPLFDVAGSQSPNLWWPDTRAWLVSTEVDGFSSYIGGSRALIDDLTSSRRVEALETSIASRLDPGPYRPHGDV